MIQPPLGSDVVEDWYPFWALAKRLGIPLRYDGVADLDMDQPPSSDELLRIRARNTAVPIDEIRRHEGGCVFPIEATVGPGRNHAVFDVMPDDVRDELRAARVERAPDRDRFPFLLASRRMRDLFNSNGYYLPTTRKRNEINPLSLHSLDMEKLGLANGDEVNIRSDNGCVRAIASRDDTLRPGVVTISHGWGGLPNQDGDCRVIGTNINQLISDERDVEAVNAMPRMSAIPVAIDRADPAHRPAGSA